MGQLPMPPVSTKWLKEAAKIFKALMNDTGS
jgi:hypothetical protein